MSGFVVKVRGGSSAVREFMCPVHGVFETREPGDEVPCPHVDIFTRDACGMTVEQHLYCFLPSPRTFTVAPLGRVKVASVTQGKVSEKPTPYALDTQPLADGMSKSEWKKRRSAMWNEKRRKELKEKIG